ncbi:hypothetical protein P154DRAFT_536812 [Amniculicola lignicola CBS 123094]|uniref:Heterokaryon incompatibility domain-containing protein n=1 Tax=Amniculicola lignicola CBS 123094 TaxID=1392246 RepID=A0A6A5W8P5_9PLEO|nr:hypothetical protein P154DRAFT_536812 [Amniculicola lignicola CBS 123094]
MGTRLRLKPRYKPLHTSGYLKPHDVRVCRFERYPKFMGPHVLGVQNVVIDTVTEIQTQADLPSDLGKATMIWFNMYQVARLRSSATSQPAKPDNFSNEDFIACLTLGRHCFLPSEYLRLLSHQYPKNPAISDICNTISSFYRTSTRLMEKIAHASIDNLREMSEPRDERLVHQDLEIMKKSLGEVGCESNPGYSRFSAMLQELWTSVMPHTYPSASHLDLFWKLVFFQGDWKSRGHRRYDCLRSNMKKCNDDIRTVIADRMCFTTESGKFGICSPGTQPGDLVAVLPNYQTPFITRRCSKAEMEERIQKGLIVKSDFSDETREFISNVEYVRMVGDCYVHSFMKGEKHMRGERRCE